MQGATATTHTTATSANHIATAAAFVFEAIPSLPTAHVFEDQADGRVIVRRVPIFAEVGERGGVETPWNAKWVKAALAKAQAQPGYWMPVHYRHHADGADAGRAGDARPTEVATALVDGKPKAVLFADLRFDSRAEAEHAVKKFPYRSVEISPEKPDEINSLALLGSEAPYHRFPNLTAFATARGMAFVWRHPLMSDIASPAATFEAGSPPAADAEKPAETATYASKADFEAFKTEIRALFESMTKKDEKHEEPAEDDAEKNAKRQPIAAAKAATTGGAKFEAASDEALAATKLEAVNDALTARLEALEKERLLEKKAATFSAELAPYGEHHVKKGLEILAAKGEEHARTYAETIKTTVPRLPRAAAARRPDLVESDEPKAVAAYAGDPARLKKARDAAAFFAANPSLAKSGPHGAMSLEGFLRAELGPVEA